MAGGAGEAVVAGDDGSGEEVVEGGGVDGFMGVDREVCGEVEVAVVEMSVPADGELVLAHESGDGVGVETGAAEVLVGVGGVGVVEVVEEVAEGCVGDSE